MALDDSVQWPPKDIMQFFMHALITLVPPGIRWSEGEKRFIRKMISEKTDKFGEQDKVRTVDMTNTVPKLKRRARDIFFVA